MKKKKSNFKLSPLSKQPNKLSQINNRIAEADTESQQRRIPNLAIKIIEKKKLP